MFVYVESAALRGVSMVVNHGLLSIFSLKPSPIPPVFPCVTLAQCCMHSHIRAERDGAALHRDTDFLLELHAFTLLV